MQNLFARIRLPSLNKENKNIDTLNYFGGSFMRKMQQNILKDKKIYVGLEDSKRNWKIWICHNKEELAYTTMQVKSDVLLQYFHYQFPNCYIILIYEAGFHGLSIYDELSSYGMRCIVTSPNKVTQEKD